MARSLNLLPLLVALLAVQVFSAVVREEDVARVLEAELRAATIISTVTTTATGATTTTKSTRLVCATLVSPIATTACRRKRQFWSTPIFIQLDQDGEFNPSQVLRVEPSAVPEFRNRPSSIFRPFAPQYASPYAVQPSFGEKAVQVAPLGLRFGAEERFFGPYRLSAFSSLFSNIISSILTPAVTSTSTKTVYTTTATATSYTSTVTYTLRTPACVPPGVSQCPADSTSTTTAATTTTTASSSTTTTTASSSSTTTSTAPTSSTDSTTSTTTAPTTAPTDATTTVRRKREADNEESNQWAFQKYIKSLSS